MAKVQSDRFANQAIISMVETVANTLVFKKLETGISLFEKLAWLIARIQYYVPLSSLDLMIAAGDSIEVALTATDQLASIPLENNAVIDKMILGFSLRGAAASFQMGELVVTHDLSTLPGGGILVPPNPLYGGLTGSSLAAVTSARVKLYYTNYELEVAEYWELVESRRMVAS